MKTRRTQSTIRLASDNVNLGNWVKLSVSDQNLSVNSDSKLYGNNQRKANMEAPCEQLFENLSPASNDMNEQLPYKLNLTANTTSSLGSVKPELMSASFTSLVETSKGRKKKPDRKKVFYASSELQLNRMKEIIKIYTPKEYHKYRFAIKRPARQVPKLNLSSIATESSLKSTQRPCITRSHNSLTGRHFIHQIDVIAMSGNISQFTTINRKKKLLILAIEEQFNNPIISDMLEALYPYFTLGLWYSSLGKGALEKFYENEKITDNDIYWVTFVLDNTCIMNINHPKLGHIGAKPLKVIYNRFSNFNYKNTIVVDSNSHASLLNPREFLIMTETETYDADDELQKLFKYLLGLATVDDFSKVSFLNWKAKLNSFKKMSSN